jgi:hypothetical protein
MKFKFYYVKHKVTGEFVSYSTFNDDEDFCITSLDLSKWESDQPYLTSREELQRLLNGEFNNSYCTQIYNDLKKAIKECQLEIIEVEL